jgi:hypothetical protein
VLALSTFTVYYIQVMGVRGSVTVQNETLSSSNIWDSDFTTYQNIDQFLEEQGILAEDIVMVNDPPLFYWATTQSSIIVPNGTPEEVFQTALQYSADYLVIEPEHVLGLNEMYDGINGFPWFDYLGTVNGSQIYRINP